MKNTPTHTRRRPKANSGFTLVEILISLGLFAIGMIAVASLFPVAALLQRETISEVIGEHAAQSAQAIVEAKRLTYDPPTSGLTGRGDLGTYHTLAGPTLKSVVPLHAIDNALLVEKLTFGDRSYPSSLPIIEDRNLFWVPFVQNISGDVNNPNWVMRLFLLETDSRVNYNATGGANPLDPNFFPKVVGIGCSANEKEGTFTLANTNHGLRSGDKIMDSNGTDYQIAEVNGATITVVGLILISPEKPRTIWYAPAYTGTRSPTKRIVSVKIDVFPR